MKKLKLFLNSMEERFVFPIGRRTWQILSLLAITLLTCCVIYFVTNSTPTSRENIKVTKEEVVDEKIDTQQVANKEAINCQAKDLQAAYDTIKKYTPSLEWKNLVDSSQTETVYVTDEFGNYILLDNYIYKTQEVKRYVENASAVPNILENIFRERSVDSTDYCERIITLNALIELCKVTSPKFLQPDALIEYSKICSELPSISVEAVQKSNNFKGKLEGKISVITNQQELQVFIEYLVYITQNSIDNSKLETAIELINKHRGLKKKDKFENSDYFGVTKLLLEVELSEEDLENAINEFGEDIDYYEKNGFIKSLRTYLNLYKDKMGMAENNKQIKESEKSANRLLSLTYGMYAFISIVGIATILLLFSIQSILKQQKENK